MAGQPYPRPRISNSSKAPSAFLLRWLASLTRDHAFVLRPISVPGNSYTIADFCSRSFHLPDQVFLRHLNTLFPTAGGWQLVHPTNATVCEMTSALSCVMSPWAIPVSRKCRHNHLGCMVHFLLVLGSGPRYPQRPRPNRPYPSLRPPLPPRGTISQPYSSQKENGGRRPLCHWADARPLGTP
jgi:hypothetical protein